MARPNDFAILSQMTDKGNAFRKSWREQINVKGEGYRQRVSPKATEGTALDILGVVSGVHSVARSPSLLPAA